MNVVSKHLPLLFSLGVFLAAGSAVAADFRTCVKWEIKTADSGGEIPAGPNLGGTEDRYADGDAGMLASAVGVRIRVQRTGFDETYDTEPDTGCIDWEDTDGHSYDVTVYAFQSNHHGSYVRLHTPDLDCTDSPPPGQTYSAFITSYNPVANSTDQLYVGDEVPYWTGQAMLGYSLYRYHSHHGGGDDFVFHAARDLDTGCYSSAHFSDSNSYIHSGSPNRHCIRLADCTGRVQINSKFVAAHEFGHALAALHYGVHASASDGPEPNVDTTWSGTTDDPGECAGGTYGVNTVEYNSVGFREGFAHFYSSRVFNDKDAEGAFTLFGLTHDLERYNKGAADDSGGHLENNCCDISSCDTGNGTNLDWKRFFWDWYTSTGGSCAYQPDGEDMLDLYMYTRLGGGLQKDNYFTQMDAAVGDLGLAACLEGERFDTYAAHNGIDNQ